MLKSIPAESARLAPSRRFAANVRDKIAGKPRASTADDLMVAVRWFLAAFVLVYFL